MGDMVEGAEAVMGEMVEREEAIGVVSDFPASDRGEEQRVDPEPSLDSSISGLVSARAPAT